MGGFEGGGVNCEALSRHLEMFPDAYFESRGSEKLDLVVSAQ